MKRRKRNSEDKTRVGESGNIKNLNSNGDFHLAVESKPSMSHMKQIIRRINKLEGNSRMILGKPHGLPQQGGRKERLQNGMKKLGKNKPCSPSRRSHQRIAPPNSVSTSPSPSLAAASSPVCPYPCSSILTNTSSRSQSRRKSVSFCLPSYPPHAKSPCASCPRQADGSFLKKSTPKLARQSTKNSRRNPPDSPCQSSTFSPPLQSSSPYPFPARSSSKLNSSSSCNFNPSRHIIQRSISWSPKPTFCAWDCVDEFADLRGRHLLMASFLGRTRDVRNSLDAGADVNYSNSCKWTPLHRAAAKAHSRIVALLLERGANVRSVTSYGCTPLHFAAQSDPSGKCVMYLLAAASNANKRNRSGQTPLHLAAQCGNLEAVAALVTGGARTDIKDNAGKTALDVASTDGVWQLLSAESYKYRPARDLKFGKSYYVRK